MKEFYDFNDLFVLDLANNHQGSIEHGLTVIRSVAEVAKRHNIRAALKFQYRQLDSFIHRDYRESSDNKHVGRFLSTALSRAQFQTLLDEVRKQGLIPMCTPFDEESVRIIVEEEFEILKVASCSAKDFPLLEEVAATGLPVIFSTGGLELHNIDDLVSFFDHRGTDYAIMHCVSIYPVPDELLRLNQIEQLRERYPGRVIGWSTHENPDDTLAVAVAVAKGARIFERHVGVETEEIKLNAYSSTPEQVDRWLQAYKKAKTLCGVETRPPVPDVERQSIDSLRRGVFAKRPIKEGTEIARHQVYFAMPYLDGQLESGKWKEDIRALVNIDPHAPVLLEHVVTPEKPDVHIIKTAVHEVKALLNQARIPLNREFTVEYSHHYGIPRFREVGAVIIECVNREYCKKLIVQLPGQWHPSHYHALKEETFQVLYGTLNVEVEGHEHVLKSGETILIQPGVWHSFGTDTGVVVEEISTTHYDDDSHYKDKAINRMKRSERKTIVDHWGRFQLNPEFAQARTGTP